MIRLISDRAFDTRMVRALFRALLHREPEPQALDHFLAQLQNGLQLSDVAGQIVSSAEFGAKLIDLPFAEPPSSVQASGAETKEGPTTGLHFVVVSTDGMAKVENTVRQIAARLGPEDLITVLDGSRDATEPVQIERVERARFPGASVYHLRMRLPSIARSKPWMILLEDHVIITADWVDRVRSLVDRASHGASAYIGSVANLTSRSAWSWANFLLTFSPVWHPIQDLNFFRLHAGNVLFATDSMPTKDFEFGEFESSFLPRVCACARMSNEIWVDHVQPCSLVRAVSLHFHSGRIAGARMRLGTEDAWAGLCDGVARLTRGRVRRASEIVAGHPLRHELPRFTLARMRVLTVAVAVGFVLGSALGYGRSPWMLE